MSNSRLARPLSLILYVLNPFALHSRTIQWRCVISHPRFLYTNESSLRIPVVVVGKFLHRDGAYEFGYGSNLSFMSRDVGGDFIGQSRL